MVTDAGMSIPRGKVGDQIQNKLGYYKYSLLSLKEILDAETRSF